MSPTKLNNANGLVLLRTTLIKELLIPTQSTILLLQHMLSSPQLSSRSWHRRTSTLLATGSLPTARPKRLRNIIRSFRVIPSCRQTIKRWSIFLKINGWRSPLLIIGTLVALNLLTKCTR